LGVSIKNKLGDKRALRELVEVFFDVYRRMPMRINSSLTSTLVVLRSTTVYEGILAVTQGLVT